MDFPEVEFGSKSSLESANNRIRHAMKLDTDLAGKIQAVSEELKKTFLSLEPYFQRYTEKICKKCPTPCCVNRHGFPDFEDLIVFNALSQPVISFDFNKKDTAPCQFLGRGGCTLERCARSYRCTWYFCDKVFEIFETEDKEAFKRFEHLLVQLGQQRMVITDLFERLWILEKEFEKAKGILTTY